MDSTTDNGEPWTDLHKNVMGLLYDSQYHRDEDPETFMARFLVDVYDAHANEVVNGTTSSTDASIIEEDNAEQAAGDNQAGLNGANESEDIDMDASSSNTSNREEDSIEQVDDDSQPVNHVSDEAEDIDMEANGIDGTGETDEAERIMRAISLQTGDGPAGEGGMKRWTYDEVMELLAWTIDGRGQAAQELAARPAESVTA